METVTDDELPGKEAKGGDLTGQHKAVIDDELRGKEAKGGDLTGQHQAVTDDELRGYNGVVWGGRKMSEAGMAGARFSLCCWVELSWVCGWVAFDQPI